MKRKILLLFAPFLFFLVLLTACKGESKLSSDEFKLVQDTLQMEIEAFRSSLTKADTTVVRQMCDECMEQLKRQNVDVALSNLYVYENGDIVALSEDQINQQMKKFALMPVLNYSLDSFNFATIDNNDVKYKIQFDENDSQAISYFMFNPVKVNDSWYLTIKNIGDAVNLGK